MLGTLFGMAPLCFAQAYFAEAIFTVCPWLLYPLIIVCVMYVLYVVKLVRGLSPNRTERRADDPSLAVRSD
jgi:threonine/homoserine/homoserine lactone efflux protein